MLPDPETAMVAAAAASATGTLLLALFGIYSARLYHLERRRHHAEQSSLYPHIIELRTTVERYALAADRTLTQDPEVRGTGRGMVHSLSGEMERWWPRLRELFHQARAAPPSVGANLVLALQLLAVSEVNVEGLQRKTGTATARRQSIATIRENLSEVAFVLDAAAGAVPAKYRQGPRRWFGFRSGLPFDTALDNAAAGLQKAGNADELLANARRRLLGEEDT